MNFNSTIYTGIVTQELFKGQEVSGSLQAYNEEEDVAHLSNCLGSFQVSFKSLEGLPMERNKLYKISTPVDKIESTEYVVDSEFFGMSFAKFEADGIKTVHPLQEVRGLHNIEMNAETSFKELTNDEFRLIKVLYNKVVLECERN